MMESMDHFESWKSFLADKLNHAENEGITNKAVSNIAYFVGDYLAKNVQPDNDEEKLLKDLWNAASKEEQKAIASSMVKLIQQNK